MRTSKKKSWPPWPNCRVSQTCISIFWVAFVILLTATGSSEAYDFVSCNPDSGKFDTACFADFKISNSPSALLNSLNPATAQAILARAARVTSRTRATPAPAARRKLVTPAPTPIETPPGTTPATTPTGSDSEEEEVTMAQASSDPLQYNGAFKERDFVLKQAMKAKVTKKGTCTSEELRAYQTDQVIETAQRIQMQQIYNGAADGHREPGSNQSRHAHEEHQDDAYEIERHRFHPASDYTDCMGIAQTKRHSQRTRQAADDTRFKRRQPATRSAFFEKSNCFRFGPKNAKLRNWTMTRASSQSQITRILSGISGIDLRHFDCLYIKPRTTSFDRPNQVSSLVRLLATRR